MWRLWSLVIGALVTVVTRVEGVPLSFTIERGKQECLYDVLHEGEHMTMSVFITAGEELKATAEITGPIAPQTVKTGSELWNHVELFEQGRSRSPPSLRESHMVNYEDLPHLHKYADLHLDDDDYHYDDDALMADEMYYYYDLDADEPVFMNQYDDDTISEEDKKDFMESDKREYEEKIKHYREVRDARELKRKQKKAHKTLSKKREHRAELMEMTEGGPFQRTYLVDRPGWYRVCVHSHYKIVAEIELRKQSELGFPNRHTGHLMTYERFEMLKEERKIDRLTRVDPTNDPNHANDEGIPNNQQLVKPQDVLSLNDKLRKIHRTLLQVKEKQQREKHRLTVSAAVNEHTHSKMVTNSIFETAFYVAISAFQVYTIRKWFAGGPMLGF